MVLQNCTRLDNTSPDMRDRIYLLVEDERIREAGLQSLERAQAAGVKIGFGTHLLSDLR